MQTSTGSGVEVGVATDGGQFLTFKLQNEEFGIEILKVQEIKGFTQVTPVPNTPPHINGVMNLRGTVVPVMDLRARFNIPRADYDQFTVIIVADVLGKVVGLVVDAVSDVLNFQGAQIESSPDFGTAVDTSYLTGLAKVEERLVMLLNLESLICELHSTQPEARAA